MKCEIYQNRSSLTIEGEGVFVVAFAEHFFGIDARHFFNGPVPGDNLSTLINDERRVRQELDDFRKEPLGFPQLVFCVFTTCHVFKGFYGTNQISFYIPDGRCRKSKPFSSITQGRKKI